MSPTPLDRDRVAHAIKKLVVADSRLQIDPGTVTDDELLNGPLLRINSLGFVGMLIRLEDELDITLPDDLFVGRTFNTVADLIDVVLNHRSEATT
ncbi:acyl carrier protein [Burkholderia ubonensis]|uniref:Acyl carrier protein n=1 Tax=Burkholderia ubonensis TaxID=101571 RepID=A0A105KDF9_9BURK|nr:acyl carrier protein [Burkholderia ubonensis]KVG73582.1 acyl carrier protein [Burkholderia ubonensis]KVT52598.1 acyl carrier protein [Burkholderia ubonensis]